MPKPTASHRQAHGQTPRHSHAPTRRETAGRRKLLSQSHSTCERPGPEERAGGRLSGETEAERDEGSETDWKTARGSYRQTDALARARAHTHTHTHTRTQRQRASDRETANGRQTGERGWHRIRDRHTGTDRDAPQREAARKQQLPQGRGRQPWAGPAGRLKAVPWGWRSPVETPRLPRLQGPIRLGYLKRDPAPAPRPEGECVRVCVCVCVSVSVGEGGVGSTWGRMDTQSGGGRVWTPPAWEACVVLLLSLSPSFSVSLTCGFQLLNCLGGGVYLPKPKATFSGDVVKGQCTLTHLIYPKILDMSGLRL